MVELTKDEAESLMNHLEIYIVQEIRDDDEYDNLGYLREMQTGGRRC